MIGQNYINLNSKLIQNIVYNFKHIINKFGNSISRSILTISCQIIRLTFILTVKVNNDILAI
jgi:hypothetical protein